MQKKCQQWEEGSTQAPNLRSNSIQEGEDNAYAGGHIQEGENEIATHVLEGPMTRGRLKRIQEEVYQELSSRDKISKIRKINNTLRFYERFFLIGTVQSFYFLDDLFFGWQESLRMLSSFMDP
ncbi:hypothetical protein CR513_59132, partial [Mucuna pruriens]